MSIHELRSRLLRSRLAPVLGLLVLGAAGTARADAHPDRYVVAALGDSISIAFDASYLGANDEMSWTTGDGPADAVNSHALRLQALTAKRVDSYNEAFLGAKSTDLAGQVAQLAPERPDYVTILIGANDLCNWTETLPGQSEGVVANVLGAIDILIASNPAVKILLVPVPDMRQMYEIGSQRDCHFFWEVTRICSALLSNRRTAVQRREFYARWASLNASLELVATVRPSNARFARRVMLGAIDQSQISSLDCFHPSIAGQQHLADDAWAGGWFTDQP